jgi:3-deoxy-7-phosphoheptulonate synthase
MSIGIPLAPAIDTVTSLPADHGHLGAAGYQPDWPDPVRAAAVGAELSRLPGLVTWEELRVLRMLLSEAAMGHCQVIQAGDCAEDPAECTPQDLARKVGLLDALAGVMKAGSGLPVIRIGRIAGQFAKPRSAPTETVDGRELPAFRGHLVNGPGVTERSPDPDRMLSCYHAAGHAMAFLRQRTSSWAPSTGATVWSSHEALILDYELPLLRRTRTGQAMLTSTHLPWIGERTRDPDGSHVRLLAELANPVACKLGPTATPDEVVELCARLDPAREPGRLTLITRMGAKAASSTLPPLVEAVRAAGHPVIWLCDPMHANTIKTPRGRKTRSVDTLIAEVEAFQFAVAQTGGTPAGLHLETTPDDVSECAWSSDTTATVDEDRRYTSLCDPRLNLQQAITVTQAWRVAAAEPWQIRHAV